MQTARSHTRRDYYLPKKELLDLWYEIREMPYFVSNQIREPDNLNFYRKFFLPAAFVQSLEFLFSSNMDFDTKYNDIVVFGFIVNSHHCQQRLINIIVETDQLVFDSKISLENAIALAQNVLSVFEYNHSLIDT